MNPSTLRATPGTVKGITPVQTLRGGLDRGQSRGLASAVKLAQISPFPAEEPPIANAY